MQPRPIALTLTLALFLFLTVTTPARADSTIVAAGQTLDLTKDLVLTDIDTLEVNGTPDEPCRIEGHGFCIRNASDFYGKVKITYATLHDLGKTQKVIKTKVPGEYATVRIEDPDAPAINIAVARNADITIDHCTFDASSNVVVTLDEKSTINFRANTMLENALYPVSEQPTTSRNAITVSGNSKAPKFFQGNRIAKGICRFRTANMLIGGDRDEDSNLIIGMRAKIEADGASTVVKGNYLHCLLTSSKVPPFISYWSQVSTFTAGEGVLVEHNIIRDGEWIVQFIEGEFRYNLICDIKDHNLMRNGSVGKIHHNIFFVGKPAHGQGEMYACISVIYPPRNGQTGIEIFNNVFDGTDTFGKPGVDVGAGGLVASLRNNVFCNFQQGPKYIKADSAVICVSNGEEKLNGSTDRLGYADYNCFYNPLSTSKTLYSIGVKGKTLRRDDGFAKHDLPAGGAVDAQVDPQFKGPLPKEFPFNDEDIKSGKVTVSQMLRFYRDAYTPAEGSPLLNAGDPADGKNSYIGAVGLGVGPGVGPGKDAPADHFGKLGTTAEEHK